MKKRRLSIPQLAFIAGTRAALGAGVALLASHDASRRVRHAAGLMLALFGAATTIPAACMVAGKRPPIFKRLVLSLR